MAIDQTIREFDQTVLGGAAGVGVPLIAGSLGGGEWGVATSATMATGSAFLWLPVMGDPLLGDPELVGMAQGVTAGAGFWTALELLFI